MTLKKLYIAAAASLAVFLAACGDSSEFTVAGSVEGKPNMNLYYRYYAGEAARNGITLAKEGDFQFRGVSRQPTVVEVLDNEGRVLGRAYVANGQRVEMKVNRQNPYKTQVKGTPASEKWSGWLNEHADSLLRYTPEQANAAIERYIAQNNAEVSAGLLFLTSYAMWVDPQRADSVGQSLAPEARPSVLFGSYSTLMAPYSDAAAFQAVDTLLFRTRDSDTAYVFTPHGNKPTLIAISDEHTSRADSLLAPLRRLHRSGKAQLVDIMLASDTSTWLRSIRQDSAAWLQGWAPGLIFARGLDRLALPQVPYYIIVDTAGCQVYRTPSITNALRRFASAQ